MSASPRKRSPSSGIQDFLSDIRVLRIVAQIIFVIILATALIFFVGSIVRTLNELGLIPTFEFLERRAGFAINQAPEWYSSNSTYGQAFLVGVQNTLRVVSVGLVSATVLGIFLGIFLLSNNWLIRTISRAYVEILRNTPLLVQLIFWYYVVILGLPETDITLPSEGILVIWLRFFSYLFVILGVWGYVSNVKTAPPKLLNGVLTAILIAEAAFWLLGSNVVVIVALAILGAAALWMGRSGRIPKEFEGYVLGAGVLAIAQLVGHLITFGLFQAGVLAHPQLVYDSVEPLFYLRRKGIVIPAIFTNARSILFFGSIIAGFLLALVASNALHEYSDRTGRPAPVLLAGFGVFVLFGLLGWYGSQLSPLTFPHFGLPEASRVGLPTARLGVYVFVAYLIAAAFWVYNTYQNSIAKKQDRNPLAMGVVTVLALVIGIWMFNFTGIVFPDDPEQATTFQRALQFVFEPSLQVRNLPLLIVFTLAGIGAGVLIAAWGWRFNREVRDPVAANRWAVFVGVSIVILGFGFANLPDGTTIIGEGDEARTVTYEEALEEALLEGQELFQLADEPIAFRLPEQNRFGRVQVGSEVGPSFMALFLGLVIYTSAFIGEIVRAGIQAVPFGQIEAARALGLSRGETLRSIVLPQALRVIIPPMGNQYLNLSKNSSLATFVAYADTYQVGTTMMNQSGQSITGFALVLLTYLAMSLVISFVMNLVNARFQLVTR